MVQFFGLYHKLVRRFFGRDSRACKEQTAPGLRLLPRPYCGRDKRSHNVSWSRAFRSCPYRNRPADTGGLPDAVNAYLNTHNIQFVRDLQSEIQEYYTADATKYDKEHKLHISRIYNLIPSTLENKKKRLIVQDIENKKGAKYKTYLEDFDYLINSGIALEVKAISNPKYPLIESETKNLLKLYLNDVGLLTNTLYSTNINAILDDANSINLGSVYETVVASELIAHGFRLFYYDNRSKGEVDYIIDDYLNLTALPIEVKSGKDYSIHSALNNLLSSEDYHIKKAYVLSNERLVKQKGKIIYLPIYYVMFITNTPKEEDLYF